jgi:hypothetical protein
VVDVYVHPFISTEEIEVSTVDDLSKKCFDLIEAPLKMAHPELMKKM